MKSRKQNLIRLYSDTGADHHPGEHRDGMEEVLDVELLDAYSHAVIRVVESTGPAVVGIRISSHRLLTRWSAGSPMRLTILRRGRERHIDIIPSEK